MTPPNGTVSPVAEVTALFERRFGSAPAGVWSAPGRANLIGEHTDYNDGLVLPFAIDHRTYVAAAHSDSGKYRAISAQMSGGWRRVDPARLTPRTGAARGWVGYVFGVLWVLRRRGHRVPPLDLAVTSTVPPGAGLSSSAAVECAVALAVSDLLGLGLDAETVARVAQQAENDFVGVPCGLMDQMASAASTAGHALFFDVGAGSTRQIPFDTAAAGLELLVIDTRVRHSLADGEYGRRRADCEQAARELGVRTLSQLIPGDLPTALPRLRGDRLRRRVRHVVSENQRVRATVAALEAGDWAAIGPLLSASHASLRDDYEVSCAELDLAAGAAEEAGALGARMVGGGFGGSVIALVPAERARAVAGHVMDSFDAAGYTTPVVRAVHPTDGARRDR